MSGRHSIMVNSRRRARPPGGHLILVMTAHLPDGQHGGMDPAPALYAIRIKGQLGATALSAFPAMAPRSQGTDTVLTGLLDQSALFGVLAEVEALGLDLLEVRQLSRPPAARLAQDQEEELP
ncbi:MAG TPA: hypothetical protein VGM79_12925 [Streptosporangiaceae bacterium]